MALIGPRMRRYKGTLTTDGAGAATADITIPTGYKLRRISLSSGDPSGGGAPLTGGTLKAQDTTGAGTIHATVTPTGANESVDVNFNATAVVTALRVSVTGGGATKKAGYAVWLQRTRAH